MGGARMQAACACDAYCCLLVRASGALTAIVRVAGCLYAYICTL